MRIVNPTFGTAPQGEGTVKAAPVDWANDPIILFSNNVTAQVLNWSRRPEVCDRAIRIGVQGLQDIPALLPGC